MKLVINMIKYMVDEAS